LAAFSIAPEDARASLVQIFIRPPNLRAYRPRFVAGVAGVRLAPGNLPVDAAGNRPELRRQRLGRRASRTGRLVDSLSSPITVSRRSSGGDGSSDDLPIPTGAAQARRDVGRRH